MRDDTTVTPTTLSASRGHSNGVAEVAHFPKRGGPLKWATVRAPTTPFSQRAEPSPLWFGNSPKRRIRRGTIRISPVRCEKGKRGCAARVPLPPGWGGLPTICQEVETRFVWPSVTGIHPFRKPGEPIREPRLPHRPQAAGCALEKRLRQRQPGRGPGRSRYRHAAWHRRRLGADRPPSAGRAHDRGRGRVAPGTCRG